MEPVVGNAPKKFVKSKLIAQNELYKKKLNIRVYGGIVIDAGLFSAKFLQYTVFTEPFNYEVKRKTQDFYTLRKMLSK